MDWALAIERNRQPLLRIVAVLCSMIGLGEGSFVARVSRPVHRAVLSVLRPAEAAVRRLIVVAARGIVVKPKTPRTAPAGRISSCRMGQGRVTFQLFDPRRVLASGHGWRAAGTRGEPRIHVIDVASIPAFPCSARHPRSHRTNPIRRRIIPSMPGRCAAASRRSARLSKTCRARRSAMPAGGPGPPRPAARSGWNRSAPARRPDCAGSQPTRWTRSWPSATGSPATRRPPTRHECDGLPS